jgi:hypothetical protein
MHWKSNPLDHPRRWFVVPIRDRSATISPCESMPHHAVQKHYCLERVVVVLGIHKSCKNRNLLVHKKLDHNCHLGVDVVVM